MPSPRWSTATLVVSIAVAAATGYLAGNRAGDTAIAPSPKGSVASTKTDHSPAAGSQRASSSEGDERKIAAHGDRRWSDLSAAARTPKIEREMADILAELATRDHDQAMNLALAEPNLRTRTELRNAVLRGWAKVEPQAAADWAIALNQDDRTVALAAVFAGAVDHPAEAAKVGATVCDRDPDRAFEYGQSLVAALADRGDYETGVQFVIGRPASPQRIEQAENAFTTWAQHRPSEALAASSNLADPEARDAAFRGVAIGWSQADPAGLAQYAIQMPPSENRGLALANAVPRWVEHDPMAAATWLSQRDPSPDLDMGVNAVAMLPSIIAQRPELAVSLAQSISDSSLRSTTLHQVAVKWAEKDPAAAAQFVASSAQFAGPEKEAILAEIRETSKR